MEKSVKILGNIHLFILFEKKKYIWHGKKGKMYMSVQKSQKTIVKKRF